MNRLLSALEGPIEGVALVQICEELEFEMNRSAVMELALLYATLIGAHTLQGELHEARLAYHRVISMSDCSISKQADVQSMWRILQALWDVDWALAQSLLQTSTFSPALTGLQAAMVDGVRALTLQRLPFLYMTIRAKNASAYLGLSNDAEEAAKMLQSVGWTLSSDQTLLHAPTHDHISVSTVVAPGEAKKRQACETDALIAHILYMERSGEADASATPTS